MSQETDPIRTTPQTEADVETRRSEQDAAGDRAPGYRTEFPLHSVSRKLLALLLATMLVIFGVLGWVSIRLSRQHLESFTLTAAERMSDVIKRNTSSYMMRNDRNGLYEMMQTMADEPGVKRMRIINQEGRISFSTDPVEVESYVDKNAEACYGCHAQAEPLARINRPDRFRIYKSGNERVLAIITPIENQPGCSSAACHAHPANQQILGVLDTHLSLARADANIKQASERMIFYTVLGAALIALLTWLFIWRVVHKPLTLLRRGTERLAKGELGYQIKVDSSDEVGRLASSFNMMSAELLSAHSEIDGWNKTLEKRVDEKTKELRRAHEQMLQVERMVAIGKMSAVVAHEINNPLSGILTYAKLMKKWISRGIEGPERKKEIEDTLDLIASESRRCGDLVKNLLTFSRTSPMNLGKADLNNVVDRCVRLVQHKFELSAIQLETELGDNLPIIYCDSAQIEQVLLALVMNAVDAMPHGGNLWITTRALPDGDVQFEVRDDGMGIPPELLPKLFEPFTTTKDVGKGVGLGLAISKGIVDRHGGKIEIDSTLGRGTTFRVTLPVDARIAPAKAAELAAKN